MNATLQYYNENARAFCDSTIAVDFSLVQERFLKLLTPGARILDFGCGSGRDTGYFLERGYEVDAVDGSEELCRLASEYAGVAVRQMMFDELDSRDLYDGVWACSSILHVEKALLPGIMGRISDSLHVGGVFYTSFKYGDYDGMRNGRHFSDFTEESFKGLLAGLPELVIEDLWVSGDVRPGRAAEQWLNLIMRKQ